MSNLINVTQALCAEIATFGSANLTSSVDFISGASHPGINGDIRGEKFRVMMFDLSEKEGLSAASAHITLNINEHAFSSEHLEFWNSDNRFTKIYRRKDDTYLVMDAFVAVENTAIIHSVAKIWDISVRGIASLKSSYERRSRFR